MNDLSNKIWQAGAIVLDENRVEICSTFCNKKRCFCHVYAKVFAIQWKHKSFFKDTMRTKQWETCKQSLFIWSSENMIKIRFMSNYVIRWNSWIKRRLKLKDHKNKILFVFKLYAFFPFLFSSLQIHAARDAVHMEKHPSNRSVCSRLSTTSTSPSLWSWSSLRSTPRTPRTT